MKNNSKLDKVKYWISISDYDLKTANTELSGIMKNFSDEQKQFIFYLQPMNIEARYPKYKDSIFKSLNKEKCKLILTNTKKLQKWIKEKLS